MVDQNFGEGGTCCPLVDPPLIQDQTHVYLGWYLWETRYDNIKMSKRVNIQLTNWILWNGKFYYRDVIKMTITRAKGEGNGHFYHIEVIDLPFHTIPFVSCFISLIDITKKRNFIENLQTNLG